MAAVTLIVGEEELLTARAVSEALQAVPSADAMAVHEVTAGDLAPDGLGELVCPSLFGESRAVVVRDGQDASKELVAALLALAADGHDDVALVVVHAGGPKGRPLVAGLRGAGARVVEVPTVKTARDREQFVAAEVRRAGGSIDRDAVAELITTVGTDLRELSIACIQLVADVGPTITLADVGMHHRGRAESTGYTVADRAVEGDVVAALESLRWALSTGLDPVLVSAALASNLRSIALVGAAGRGSPDALAGPLGMPPWKVRRAQGWVRRWRPDALAAAVGAVAVADADIKGAGDDAAYAAERAVIAVATCAAP